MAASFLSHLAYSQEVTSCRDACTTSIELVCTQAERPPRYAGFMASLAPDSSPTQLPVLGQQSPAPLSSAQGAKALQTFYKAFAFDSLQTLHICLHLSKVMTFHAVNFYNQSRHEGLWTIPDPAYLVSDLSTDTSGTVRTALHISLFNAG